jgi:hypothetical protein
VHAERIEVERAALRGRLPIARVIGVVLEEQRVGARALGDRVRHVEGVVVAPATADGGALVYVAHPGTSSNQLYQLSELNILTWLMAQGIVDGSTRLHFQSWMSSPQEVGPAVSETTPHSLAHTTNRMFDELLILKALAK